jgi:hypothetical protein
MYKKSCNLLGVESFIRREPITPSFHHISKGEGIDLITAFMIRFYRHPDGSYWNSSSWQAFLKRFLDILAPEGSCYLQFNPEPDVYSENNFVDTETNSFFQRIGSFEQGVLKINRQQLQEFYEI